MSPSLSRVLLLALLGGALCPACLILDPVDFPERENREPVIRTTEPPSPGPVAVDRNDLDQVFTAFVFDEDDEDILDARAFLDGFNSVFPVVAPAEDGEPGIRVVTARFNAAFFSRGCHKLDLDVVDDASGWVGDRGVEEGVGKDTVTWFVLAHDGDGFADIPFASCPVDDPGAQQ